MHDLTPEIVADRIKRGVSVIDIAKEFDTSIHTVNSHRRWAMARGYINRPHYAYGRNRLEQLKNKGSLRLGTMTLILSELHDDEIEYLLTRMGNSKSLHKAIAGIIKDEARRNSENGN